MILSYILTITLLVLSVIKMTDIFIKSDQELGQKRQKFIQETRSIHHESQKGSITMVGILFTLMLSSLLLFFALKMKVELNEARYRKDSYLCFLYLNNETQNYTHLMGRFNMALRALFIAVSSGTGGPQAKVLFTATKKMRDGKHLYYIKKLLSNPHCKDKIASRDWLRHLPFKTSAGLLLQTNIDATTQIRSPQWSNLYYLSPTGIRRKKSFCLKADYQIQGVLQPNLKIKTAEFAMADFSKLKCLSGFP